MVPNFVFMMLDDAGVGDLDPHNPLIDTPHVTSLAKQGMTFSQMYCGSSVCSPSRAALLTGRYPVRVGIPRVLHPGDKNGMSRWERTLAELLHDQGYATGIFGKWHLGFQPWFNPTHHGFDRFVGLLRSPKRSKPTRLYEDTKRMHEPVDKRFLIRRFTDDALEFIEAQHQSRKPFFAYIPYTSPHVPLEVEPRFAGKSPAGRYGDVIEMVDYHIGRVLRRLDKLGIADNTIVVVTSDNGPWFEGSTDGLRGRKTQTYEGGVRAPFYIRWPGHIKAGSTSNAIASFLDILPTFCGMAGAKVPDDRPMDGIDLRPALRGDRMPTRAPLAYFEAWHLGAVRYKQWKLKIPHADDDHARQLRELFNIAQDPDEEYDQGPTHQRVKHQLESIADRIRKEIDKEKPAAIRRATKRPPTKQQHKASGPAPAVDTGLGALAAVLLGLGLWAGYGRRAGSRTRTRFVSWAVVVVGVIAGLIALGLALT